MSVTEAARHEVNLAGDSTASVATRHRSATRHRGGKEDTA